MFDSLKNLLRGTVETAIKRDLPRPGELVEGEGIFVGLWGYGKNGFWEWSPHMKDSSGENVFAVYADVRDRDLIECQSSYRQEIVPEDYEGDAATCGKVRAATLKVSLSERFMRERPKTLGHPVSSANFSSEFATDEDMQSAIKRNDYTAFSGWFAPPAEMLMAAHMGHTTGLKNAPDLSAIWNKRAFNQPKDDCPPESPPKVAYFLSSTRAHKVNGHYSAILALQVTDGRPDGLTGLNEHSLPRHTFIRPVRAVPVNDL